MKVSELGERGVILRIRNAVGVSDPNVVVGIGDDCAVLTLSENARLLATTDLLLENVHFRRRYAGPADIGWKAMTVNLSDIAAMGGTPRFALVALACPPDTDVEQIDAFYEGMRLAAAPHGTVIVGGDTSSSPDGWIVNVALLGELAHAPRLRSEARPGDLIAVTGTLGESAAGLALLEASAAGISFDTLETTALDVVRRAHLRPVARVGEGKWLGASPAVHAMIDLSDGLAIDLRHVAAESRVGARVRLDRLPISPPVRDIAAVLGRDPIELAVTGGEDYELLLTVDQVAFPRLAIEFQSAARTPLTAIGEIVEGTAGVQFVNARGEIVQLGEGFEHFAPRRNR